MNIDEISWVSSLQGFTPWYSTKQIPEEAKAYSPEVQGSELAECRFCCPKDLELHNFMITEAKAALEIYVSDHSPCIGENTVQHSSSPHLVLCLLENEVIMNVFQDLSELLMLCCVVLSMEWLKVPPRTNTCEHEAASVCL